MPRPDGRSHPPAGPQRTTLSGMDDLAIMHAVWLGRTLAGAAQRAVVPRLLSSLGRSHPSPAWRGLAAVPAVDPVRRPRDRIRIHGSRLPSIGIHVPECGPVVQAAVVGIRLVMPLDVGSVAVHVGPILAPKAAAQGPKRYAVT